ncbi:MAG: PAS domain-containing protein, partial [Myxococcota bacterium]
MNGEEHDLLGSGAPASTVAPSGLPEPMVALLTGMRDCACGLDLSWRVRWANEQAARHVGRTIDEALGRVLWDLFPSAVGTHLEALWRRAVTEGKPQWANLLSPITGRWVEMRVLPVKDGVVLVWSDLTAQQEEARAQRRTAEERDAARVQLDAVLDLLPVGVVTLRNTGRPEVVCNRALYRMLTGQAAPEGPSGITVEGAGARIYRDGVLLPREELPLVVAMRTGRPVPAAEYTVLRRDGARVVVTGGAIPLIDGDGRVTGAVGCFTDITDLEAALSAVEEHAAFLAALGDTVPGLLWAADADGRLEYGNRALEAYFGRPARELPPEVWWEAAHPDHAAAVTAAWDRAAGTGEPLELEYPLRRHDGAYRSFLVRATPHPDGASRRWIGIALDVTERARAEEHLRDTQRLQAVGKLAGGMAHEVNNQMTVVLGMAALAIKRLGHDHPAQGALERIATAGERAATITRQLLAFSRRQVLQPVLLDLNDVLDAFRPVLERIVGAHTSVTLALGDGRPALRADRDQLEQVLV